MSAATAPPPVPGTGPAGTGPAGTAPLPALNALELLALAFHRVAPRAGSGTETRTATPVHPSWES